MNTAPIKTNYRGAAFRDLDLTGRDFTNADFRPITDTSPFPTGDRIIRSDFTSTVLAGAVLVGARASRAIFDGTDLTAANCAGADLSQVYAPSACFIRADLTGADFTGADLTGADFTGATTTDAIFTHANLTDTRGL